MGWIEIVLAGIAAGVAVAAYLRVRWLDDLTMPGVEAYQALASPRAVTVAVEYGKHRDWRIDRVGPRWPWAQLRLAPILYKGGNGTPLNPGTPVAGEFSRHWRDEDGLATVTLAVNGADGDVYLRVRLVRSNQSERRISRQVKIRKPEATTNSTA